MKKKQHFWNKRIKILSFFLALFIVGTCATAAAQDGGPNLKSIVKTENISKIATGTGLALVPFALVKTLKDNGTYDKLDENTKAYITGLETQLNAAFKSIEDGKFKTEDIPAEVQKFIDEKGALLTKEQLKQFTDGMAAIKEHAILIEQWKDGGIMGGERISSIMKGINENKDKIKTFVKEGKAGRNLVKFEIKAGGADQAASDIATHTIGLRVPGIGQLPVRKPFIRDLFTTVNCSLEYIKYIDQETVTRNAQNVASAAPSTHTTKLTWKERSIQITAVRDLVDVPLDMLGDYDFVEGELRRLLDVNVALKVDNGLFLDNGTYPNLHSIAEVASEFDATNTLGGTITAWTGSVKTPNIFDLVMAMCSQVVALGQDGSYLPNFVLFNTIDRYKALLIKDANDNYIMPPFVVRTGNKEYNIDGMIVRSNPNVPANSVWVGDSTKGTIYQRKAAVAEMSFENATNFETEVATMKVYERLNLLIRNVDKNAFMKCTDVATALTAIAAP